MKDRVTLLISDKTCTALGNTKIGHSLANYYTNFFSSIQVFNHNDLSI